MVEMSPTARIPFNACPLCGHTSLKELRRADCRKHPLYHPVVPREIVWLICQGCRHVMTDGHFPPSVLSTIIRRTHEHQKPGHDHEQHRVMSARIAERVSRFVPHGRWLDVGFGNASLLFTAEEFGFEPVGFDLRQASVDDLKKMGIKAYCVDLLDWKDEAPFSVISMADVLEHMPFPKAALEKAHRLLAPGGVLFVSLPHYDCPTWRLLDKARQNPYWMEVEHYHNFSRERLCGLLEEVGFTFLQYAVSERYRVGMEILARRNQAVPRAGVGQSGKV